MTARPLRIGILGCANIARQFARDVAGSPAVTLAAVASRSADKAAAFGAEFGIARTHAGYEALLADRDIDAVYNPLPNHLHAEWSIRSAQAGKHVLCEKPLAMNMAEARAMFGAARAAGVMLLEAYPYWFQPQTGRLVELLQQGAIGRVMQVQASFGFTLRNPDNIRMKPETGGGALLDAGSYPASLIRLVMGSAPQRVRATSQPSGTGVDIATTATLDWDDGRQAQLRCAMNVALHRHATIVGTDGLIETEYLNHTADARTGHPWGYQPSLMRLRRSMGAGAIEAVPAPTGSGFRFAAEAFARVVAADDRDAVERAARASLDIAATLDAIADSARAGGEARRVAID
ncbi:MAG: Gfo/Idh/MocA family oxidoreductase [Rubrivivax sp.]